MMNILDQLAEYSSYRTAEAKKVLPAAEARKNAEALPKGDFPFTRALEKSGLSFICECKKASPSKGLIEPDFDYLGIAKDYERAGADCISVLTEPKWFLGSNEYLKRIAEAVKTPCLRKDFTVDEYNIYEAKLLGAKAVLLICAILSDMQLRDFITCASSLGLSALVEAHDENEIERALKAGAEIVGVNNRNLKDFSVDHSNSAKLRSLVPENVLFVAESGVSTAEDVKKIYKAGADAVLIGEALMRAKDKAKALASLKALL